MLNDYSGPYGAAGPALDEDADALGAPLVSKSPHALNTADYVVYSALVGGVTRNVGNVC